ncbi:xanthine dehydrogenase family protein molybdopterin-binding subunit [Ferrovibrio sp.]|uniref:xanthine dehydrogenase family protein molybdopterin-binding subunit n=1 Tax=Ferrovibrio sp. TaxID=1917215 RepID=UPI0035B24379
MKHSPEALPADRPHDYIGRPVLRAEDHRLLTGKGHYVGDIKRDGMLHAYIVRSPVAHGMIRSIDTSAVLASPGVVSVITFDDIKHTATPIPIAKAVELPGYSRFLEWPMASDRVRFVGEPIAVVVAESRYLAEDAADLIQIDYDMLPAVTSVDEALSDAVLLHPAAGTNMATQYNVSRGDPDAAFANPFYVRKEVFRCHRHSGMPLETRGFVAEWDDIQGKLTVWGANKFPWRSRDILANMLKLDKNRVDYIEVDVGGNFGVRGHFYPEDFLIGFLAMKLKRPVKYQEDRREHLMATHHSREASCELEIAVNQDGTISGMRARVFTDLGAYAACGGAAVVPSKTVQFIPGPYRIDNYACELNVLVTNKTPVGTFRGPGRYEGSFFCERLLDMVAVDFGLDPVEFRTKNLLTNEEIPYKGGVLVPTMGESDYDSGDFFLTLNRALETVEYDRLKEKAGKLIDGRYHGVGVCCYVDSTGVGPSESAKIVVKGPRQIDLYVGSSSCGQGIETVMAQVAAQQLGIPMEWIKVFHGTTSLVENGGGFSHSRCAVMGGSAVFITANNLIEKILKQAGLRFNAAPDMFEYREGTLYRKDSGAALLDFEGIIGLFGNAANEAEGCRADGTFFNEKLTYSYGTQIAHVAVDPETAMVEVIRFLTVEDIGRAINPLIVHGQTLGASVQGIGATFLDEFVYDGDGQLITGSFADYLVATSTEYPNVEAISLEAIRSDLNPLGVKGAGEGAISSTGAVLANAVANALAPLKVKITDLPLSPNNLSRLIRLASAGKTDDANKSFGISYGKRTIR